MIEKLEKGKWKIKMMVWNKLYLTERMVQHGIRILKYKCTDYIMYEIRKA